MSDMKRIHFGPWLLAALACGSAPLFSSCGVGDWFSDDASAAVAGAAVRRGPLAIRVIERGNLKAADYVSIRNELEGSSTILSLVKEGVQVKEGDLLCELDATSQIEKRVQQEIAVRNADAAFVKSTQNLAIQQSQNESDIAQARQKLAFAEQDRRKYLEGDKKLALSKAEQSITLQQEEFKRAENKLEWSSKLAEKGFLTATELEADRLARTRAQVLLDQATKERDLLVEFQIQRDTDKLDADLAEAQRELDRVMLQAKARLVDFESDTRTNEAKLKIEKEKLAKLDSQIGKAKIYAPKAGMVVYAKQEEGGRGMGQQQPIQEGTNVRERQELITIPTAGGMMATVSLHESVLKQVRAGMECDVKVDAVPGHVFHGKVTSVAVLPDQNSWFANPNTRLYTTMVQIFDAVEEMRPGMSCAVEIRVDDIADAVYVPAQSVFRHEGKNIAFVDQGAGKFEVVEVETGRFNDTHVQITKGLTEGQTVLLAPPATFQLQAGAKEAESAPANGNRGGMPGQAPAQGPGGMPGGMPGQGGPERGGAGDPSAANGAGPGADPAAGAPGEGGPGSGRMRGNRPGGGPGGNWTPGQGRGQRGSGRGRPNPEGAPAEAGSEHPQGGGETGGEASGDKPAEKAGDKAAEKPGEKSGENP